jgi:hypothetical protein
MHIFRHIFLSNYWWQRSGIWSQASYRYPISWEVFFDPSDSGVPIWSLWPNIRSLPSIVAEKNVTKNVHICSMCIKTKVSYRYPISWEAFFDPSDSYFLFVEERGYHKWALAHSSHNPNPWNCLLWRVCSMGFKC